MNTDQSRSPAETYWDESWLHEQYVERERSTTDIASEIGCRRQTISKWLDKHDIEIRSQGLQSDGDTEQLHDKTWLYEQYITREKSMYDIAGELDCTASAVAYWLDKHDIETRSRNQ